MRHRIKSFIAFLVSAGLICPSANTALWASPVRTQLTSIPLFSTMAMSTLALFSGSAPTVPDDLAMYHDVGSAVRKNRSSRPFVASRPVRAIVMGAALVGSLTAHPRMASLRAAAHALVQTQNTPDSSLASLADQLSVDEFIAVMTWAAPSTKPTSPTTSLWRSLVAWYDTHGTPVLDGRGLAWKPANSAELKTMLRAFEQGNPIDIFPNPVRARLEWIKTTLASPEFQQFRNHIERQLFRREPPPDPLRELLLIWFQPEARRDAYLHIINSQDFHKFQSYLKSHYGINPNADLASIMEVYLTPQGHTALYDPSRAELFALIRNYFPDPELNRFAALFLTDSVPMEGATEQNVDARRRAAMADSQRRAKIEDFLLQRSRSWANLKSIYRMGPQSGAEYSVWFRAPETTIRLLLYKPDSPSTIAGIYRYFAIHAPSRIAAYSTFSGLVAGFLIDVAKPLGQAGASLDELQSFLATCRTDLEHADLRQLQAIVQTAKTFGKTLPQVTADAQWKAFIDKVMADHPGFRDALRQAVRMPQQNNLFRSLLMVYLRGQSQVFERLNQAMAPLAPAGNLSFDLTDAELKIALLQKIQQLGMTRLKIPETPDGMERQAQLFSFEQNSGRLQDLMVQLDNGSAQSLYNSLVNDWHFETLDTQSFFLGVVQNPFMRQYFLAPQNLERFNRLRANYHFLGYDTAAQRPTAQLALKDALLSVSILLNPSILPDTPEFRALLRQYLPEAWAVADNQSGLVLGKLPSEFFALAMQLASPRFEPLRQTLQTEYGFEPWEIRLWIKEHGGGISTQDVALLQSPQLLQLYRQILQRHRSTPATSMRLEALTHAVAWHMFPPETLSALDALESIGIDTWNTENFQYILKYVLPNAALTSGLRDPEFLDFFRTMHEFFYGQANDLQALSDMRQMYFEISNKAQIVQALKSRRFQALLEYFRNRFGLVQLHPSSLVTLLAMAEHFDAKATDSLIVLLESRSESVYANDMVLIQRILHDPRLMGWVRNRPELERYVQEAIYSRPAFPRRELDTTVLYQRGRQYLESLKRTNPVAAARIDPLIARLDQQIAKARAELTERPPINQVPTLLLVRARLIYEALQQPEILRHLGDIAKRDLDDKSTEYGGLLNFIGDHLDFSEVTSHSENNGNYGNERSPYLSGGILTFHGHMISINLPVEGPSGTVNFGGDLGFMAGNHGSDAVITLLNFLPNSTMRVNVDVYTVVTLPNGERKPFIMDLGEFVLPQARSSNPSPVAPPQAQPQPVQPPQAPFGRLFFRDPQQLLGQSS